MPSPPGAGLGRVHVPGAGLELVDTGPPIDAVRRRRAVSYVCVAAKEVLAGPAVPPSPAQRVGARRAGRNPSRSPRLQLPPSRAATSRTASAT
ncbi:hypothetical protein ACLQ18_40605, partial [Streptomyces sp. DT193]|uniref:hypothetical protein n=1 Tax=Streptomyces sp. DT193 TaxID=3393418 RepID=UPI003CEC957C